MITRKKNEKCKKQYQNKYLGGTKKLRKLENLRQDKKRDIISPKQIQQWENQFQTILTEERSKFENVNNIQELANLSRLSMKEVEDL